MSVLIIAPNVHPLPYVPPVTPTKSNTPSVAITFNV